MTRYDMLAVDDTWLAETTPAGAWVLYEDAEARILALEAQVETLAWQLRRHEGREERLRDAVTIVIPGRIGDTGQAWVDPASYATTKPAEAETEELACEAGPGPDDAR